MDKAGSILVSDALAQFHQLGVDMDRLRQAVSRTLRSVETLPERSVEPACNAPFNGASMPLQQLGQKRRGQVEKIN